VNREIACLRAIFSRAVKNGKAARNPVKRVDRLSENNERDRVLSPEEYTRLSAHCDDNLRPIVLIDYHTGMRRGEIFGLTWDMVDLKAGFLHLAPEICKTDEGRMFPFIVNYWICLKPYQEGCQRCGYLPGVASPSNAFGRASRQLAVKPLSRVSPFTMCAIPTSPIKTEKAIPIS
jgi:site-specific recombinase XerD